ncbi:MAG TPA: pyruvate kinase, partial [Alphaproteobacteria bacterium]|nr:pyruvate kinase [Alphaproteobacteria bacterium]
VATLGPSSSTAAEIEALFRAGADVFRLNFSHGALADHRERVEHIRALEPKYFRPVGILMDLQGPKLRIDRFKDGRILLRRGQPFRLDLDAAPGDENRVTLPHPEVFAAIRPRQTLLLDDGRIRLRVMAVSKNHAETRVVVGGELSDRKGLNVPGAVLPVTALTKKDAVDLKAGLRLGVDWIGLSFVQRPEDVAEVKRIVAGRARVLAKLEKPQAITHLHEIVALSDGVMVARGDLGVEMPPEDVPGLQKRIIRACRRAGKPVVVATQMLDSMIKAPAPTRAEASDVATAVYDGADAMMLSAETAAGQYPLASVQMMDRIIKRIERDPLYRRVMDPEHYAPEATTSDAIAAAARQVANTISAAAIVTYSTSGSTTLRAARERPEVPIIGLSASEQTARGMTLAWGVHSVRSRDVHDFSTMVGRAAHIAHREGFAKVGESIVITAGVPFGTPGATNVLRIAPVTED